MINESVLKGKWKEIKGEMQRTWGNITNDEWDKAQGSATELSGLLQKKYGIAKDEAERKIGDIVTRYSDDSKSTSYKH